MVQVSTCCVALWEAQGLQLFQDLLTGFDSADPLRPVLTGRTANAGLAGVHFVLRS